MEPQDSKSGRLLQKSAPLEVVADQGADGSYEIRVERGAAPSAEVVVIRAEPASAAGSSGRRWGVWLVAATMVATGLVWFAMGRGGSSRPSSLEVDGATVPGPEGDTVAPVVRAAQEPEVTEDTGPAVAPQEIVLEPAVAPLAATTALGVVEAPAVEAVRAVLPAELEAAPEVQEEDEEGQDLPEGEEGQELPEEDEGEEGAEGLPPQ